jgi:hypothetical protein
MLGAVYRRGLPVLVWFAACACAGRSDEFADPRREPADPKPADPKPADPKPADPDGSYDDERPSQPPGGGSSDDLAPPEATRVVAAADAIEACSVHAAEDRAAFHYRDADSRTCVDVILVRRAKGGVAPESLGLPLDWGVGHISSYPCAADGPIESLAAATPIREATGNIAMGGGLLGLPAALGLELSLSAPAVGSDPAVSYTFLVPSLDVTRACDDSTPWALQPLNLAGPVTPSELRGCTYVGGYDRVTFQHRDPATSTCTSLTLIAYDELGYLPDGLLLPANWSVEYMDSYGCSADGAALTDLSSFTDAVGEVTFGGDPRRLPEFAWLDVTLSASEAESDSPFDLPAGPLPAPQRLLGNDAVDLSGGCTGAW